MLFTELILAPLVSLGQPPPTRLLFCLLGQDSFQAMRQRAPAMTSGFFISQCQETVFPEAVQYIFVIFCFRMVYIWICLAHSTPFVRGPNKQLRWITELLTSPLGETNPTLAGQIPAAHGSWASSKQFPCCCHFALNKFNLNGEIPEQLQDSFAKSSAYFREGERTTDYDVVPPGFVPVVRKPGIAAVNTWNTHLNQTK